MRVRMLYHPQEGSFISCSFLLILLFLQGCTSNTTFQTQKELSAAFLNSGSTPIELDAVPFFPQTQYQCGPAALATLLKNEGINTTPQALSRSVYLPEREGSLQPLLTAKVREYERLPYVREGEGLPSLFEELTTGKPVLVLQNLGLKSLPNWHYAVVVGWQPDEQKVILRSGKNRRQTRSLEFFEYTWRASNYWSLSVYSADATPANHQHDQWLKAASGLEATGKIAQAQQAYRAILNHYPSSFLATVALGNIAYQQQQYPEAQQWYQQATSLTEHPAAAWHNLAWALIRQGKMTQAQAPAARAALDTRYTSAQEYLREK